VETLKEAESRLPVITPSSMARLMNVVKMFTTQVCPYCVRAKTLLKQRGVQSISEVRVDLDPAARDQMISMTGRRTVPQIFIGDTHVGGCDDLIALDQRGGLMPLLGVTASTGA
jgi:glutaredoxin 3